MALRHTAVLQQPVGCTRLVTRKLEVLRKWLALCQEPAHCKLMVQRKSWVRHTLLVPHMWWLVLHKSLENRTVGLQTA